MIGSGNSSIFMKYRDKLRFSMAGHALRGNFWVGGLQRGGALKSCHTEFHHIIGAVFYKRGMVVRLDHHSSFFLSRWCVALKWIADNTWLFTTFDCRSHLRKLPFPFEETVVPTWGNHRSRLRELSFPLGETTVPMRGNCRSCVRKRSFPIGGKLQ